MKIKASDEAERLKRGTTPQKRHNASDEAERKSEMTNIYELANNFGQLDPYRAEQEPYEHQTAEAMVEIVVKHIDATIAALSSFTAGELDAKNNPVRLHSAMAWQHRKGFAVKVGYGSKNEALFDFGIKKVKNRKGEVVERTQTARYFKSKEDAIEFLTAIRNETEGLAELCEVKLVSYRERQAKATEAATKVAA